MLNQVLMWLFAIGVILGGTDLILGNRFGLGARFEEGFRLLGPIALSMVGIVCLAPLIADFSEIFITPLFSLVGIDPGICGSILPVDAGGYPLAMELTKNPLVGQYAGVVIGGTFGCTIAFLIPVGMGALSREEQLDFAVGLLIGLAVLPVALLLGGLLSGLTLLQILHQSLPVLILSLCLLIGLKKNSQRVLRYFTGFSKGIRIVTILGLMIGAFQHLTRWELIPALSPLEDAMKIVCQIGIVLLGCLPLSEILKRMLYRPVRWFGKKTGMNTAGTTALLIGWIIAMPAIVMLKETDRRGRIINGAFLVCGASAFSAHLGFTLGVSPEMVTPLLVAKFVGAVCAAAIAIIITKKAIIV